MRKLFLFIPLLALAMMANATSTTISPGTPNDNNIRAAFNGTADTIYLNPGEYIQENQIHFKRSAVLIAADKSNKPIIKLKHYTDLTGENTKIFVDGLIFDGAVSGQQAVCVSDANIGKELHFNDCDFRNFAKATISNSSSTYPLDSCVINNCFFYDNKKSALYFPKSTVEGVQTCYGLIVKNSTFANYDVNESAEYYASLINLETYDYSNVVATDVNVLIDHCTFYNYLTYNTDHCAIRVRRAENVIVSNCIFAHPEEYERRSTYLYESTNTVSNCVSYNLTKNTDNYTHAWGPVVTNCRIVNPLFLDAENKDFTLHYASPARRENGDVYGDPRWAKATQPIAIPATLEPVDATLSDNAGVITAAPDSIDFKMIGSREFTDIEWAKWKVSVAKDGLYSFVAHAYRPDGNSQQFEIVLLNSDESQEIRYRKDEAMSQDDTIQIDKVALESGKTYVLKVRNLYNWSKSKLLNVQASFEGGAIVTVPDTLWPVDALRSERAFVEEDSLHFTKDGETGYIHGQWAKWTIDVAEAGKYKFTANVYSTNGQNYRITLKSGDETSTLGIWYGEGNGSGARKISTELIDLAIGNYIIMIEDTVNFSRGRVANIVASYEGGNIVDVPGQILAKEAVISQVEGGHTPKMYHLMESGDLKYNNNGYHMEEFATWTLDVIQAGEMAVTLNVSHSGHIFSLELYQGDTRLDSIGEIWEGDDKTLWDDGDITLPDHLTFPATGTYTLKLLNNQQYSGGALHGITFERVPIVIDENATENGNWAYCSSSETIDLSIIRTFKGGMYNTICLPIELGSVGSMNNAFGEGYELLKLDAVTLDGNQLNLTFVSVETLEYGLPHLIKPVADVVNPSFTGRKIKTTTASTSTKGVVDFIGTFVKSEVPAGENNLFLGPDNTLYFSQTATPIKGMRAYFRVNVPGAANAIKHARIVAHGQVITSIDLVSDINEGTVKTIENGQLIIIKNGIRYNVMGVKLQ